MKHPLAIAIVSSVLALAVPETGAAQPSRSATATDAALKKRVEAALLSASDLPGKQIAVTVSGGVVTLAGQLASEGMRGVTYPPAMLQQSIGAVVRAVPGVKDVRFTLQIDAARPPPGG